MKATTAKKNVKADYAFLAFIYKKAAKSYEFEIKKVARKISRVKA